MKNKNILLNNGHSLKYINGDLWEFICAEKWMHIRFIYADNNHDIISLDSDGMGMPIMVGCQIGSYKVHSIFINDDKIIVAMKPLIKEKIKDLEPNDVIWITNSYNFHSVSKFKIKSIEYTDMPRLKWYTIISDTNRVIKIKENINANLNSIEGVEAIIDSMPERVFSNIEYAKKYMYDIIQDKINELRNKQKELMLKQ